MVISLIFSVCGKSRTRNSDILSSLRGLFFGYWFEGFEFLKSSIVEDRGYFS